MVQKVADTRANLNENIIHAAKILGRSKDRKAVFSAIYRGSNKHWSVKQICKLTRLRRVRVLQEGGKLAGNEIVTQLKVDHDIAYSKDKTLSHHKAKILRLAGNTTAQSKVPTKQNPQGRTTVQIKLPKAAYKPREITVDDVASFKAVRNVKAATTALRLSTFPEDRIKAALKRIIGETHDFRDWGGERSDLFTSKLRVKSKRQSAAFALKGKATTGELTPRKMGKNGDQIERLFTSNASVFFVVYHGKVADSIYGQMRAFALGKSMSGHSISFGVIDGDDLNRLCQGYPKQFKAK